MYKYVKFLSVLFSAILSLCLFSLGVSYANSMYSCANIIKNGLVKVKLYSTNATNPPELLLDITSADKIAAGEYELSGLMSFIDANKLAQVEKISSKNSLCVSPQNGNYSTFGIRSDNGKTAFVSMAPLVTSTYEGRFFGQNYAHFVVELDT